MATLTAPQAKELYLKHYDYSGKIAAIETALQAAATAGEFKIEPVIESTLDIVVEVLLHFRELQYQVTTTWLELEEDEEPLPPGIRRAKLTIKWG